MLSWGTQGELLCRKCQNSLVSGLEEDGFRPVLELPSDGMGHLVEWRGLAHSKQVSRDG